ncbi:HEAT repeat domain-containing protein [Myxococcota bacterium]|nr:HEAT repeat domain-containing protein [Myxococcota bacterium]
MTASSPTRPRRRAALAAAASTAALLGGLAVLHGAGARTERRPRTMPPPRGDVAFPAGETLTYDVLAESRERTTTGLGGAPVEATASLRGRLVVHGLGACEGGTCVAARFEATPDSTFSLLGHDLLALPGVGAEVRVAFDAGGRLVAAGVAPGTSDAALPVVLSLLSVVQSAPSHGAPLWTGVEPAPLGDARYAYGACEAETACVRKRLDGYARLDLAGVVDALETDVGGGARHLQAPDGAPIAVDLEESVSVRGARGVLADATRQVSLHLVDRRRDARTDPAPRWPLTALRAPSAAAQRLEQRIAGLTGDRMLADLARSSDAATLPDHARWLWRAVGLLRRSPELAATLPAAYAQMRPASPGRALVADLLAQAGTPEAQAALRAVLSGPAAQADPEYGLHLQRLSFVAEPTSETVAFARTQAAEAAPEQRGAARLALGAVAGAFCARGPSSACDDASGDLTAALGEARAAGERATLLQALGNAGTATVEPLARAAMDDDAPEVRAAAALALRKRTSPAARAALLRLGRDPSPAVATTALSALRGQTLDADAVRAIASLADAPLAHAGVAEHLALILAPHVATLPEARAALERLIDGGRTTAAQRARLRALL